MPTLKQLEAHFVRHEERQEISWDKRRPGGMRRYLVRVERLADAHGVWFLCPVCFTANQGSRGTHGVLCWFRGKVADDVTPGPGRWTPAGTGLEDLSFVPGDPPMAHSVQLLPAQASPGHCAWHGFVTNGSAA